MPDPVTLSIILCTFLLAGAVKGVIGLGLPTVCLGILTVTLDLTSAMALLLVPSLATNLWQAAVGGHGRAILRRIWPFLITATLTVWLGAAALTRVDLDLLSALLGVLLIAYSGVSLIGFRPSLTARQEAWAGAGPGLRERGSHRHDRLVRGAQRNVPSGHRAWAGRARPGHGHIVRGPSP